MGIHKPLLSHPLDGSEPRERLEAFLTILEFLLYDPP